MVSEIIVIVIFSLTFRRTQAFCNLVNTHYCEINQSRCIFQTGIVTLHIKGVFWKC